MPSQFISAMPSGPSQPPSKPPVYKRKWFIIVAVILVLGMIGSCMNGGNNARSSSTSSTGSGDSALSSNSSGTSEESISSEAIEPVDLDTLQQIFCSLTTSMTKSDIDAIIANNELYVNDSFSSAYYIGYDYQATASRGRDREGAAIDINFTSDGQVKDAQYAIHTGFSTHYGPKMAADKFNYDGVDYASGEEALYVYLAEAQPSTDADTSVETTETIYSDSKSVNDFVVAFNKAHPDLAISSDDLTVYHHHGSDHPDQVWTHLGDYRVLVSGSSVYYETYSDNQVVQDYPEANHAVFAMVLPILNPELDESTVETRWQEVLDDLTHSPKWDDGISIATGPSSDAGGIGSFEYIKITKRQW